MTNSLKVKLKQVLKTSISGTNTLLQTFTPFTPVGFSMTVCCSHVTRQVNHPVHWNHFFSYEQCCIVFQIL